MVATIKQREIDKDTLEQHTYHKYEIRYISTTHDAYGHTYMHLTNAKGQRSSFCLEFFDVEIHGYDY